MEAYFDNSATTRCYPEVAEIVVKTMTEDFGNPSAMHLKGVEAEKYVREAAQILAKILKVNEKEIIFTIAERKDLPRLKDEVKEIDPNAFISTMHASKDSPRPGI